MNELSKMFVGLIILVGLSLFLFTGCWVMGGAPTNTDSGKAMQALSCVWIIIAAYFIGKAALERD